MSLVTVIMPTKDVGPYVAAALASVLRQAGVNLEVVVIDDGSTDNTMDEVRRVADARVRIVAGPRQGVAAATNAGIAAAQGGYLANCDGDDLMPPGRLAWQARFLDAHPEFGAVCGYFSSMSRDGRFIADLGRMPHAQDITRDLQAGTTRTSFCTFLVRTALLRDLGGIRAYFLTGQDTDLQFRLSEVTRVWYELVPCYQYRLHDASITHSTPTEINFFFEEAARRFQRQRLSGQPDDLERGCPPAPPPRDTGRVVSAAEHIQGHLLAQAWAASHAGWHRAAFGLGVRACLMRPRSLKAWKSLAALALVALHVRSSHGVTTENTGSNQGDSAGARHTQPRIRGE